MKAPLLRWLPVLLGLMAARPTALCAGMMATVSNTQLQSNFNGATGAGQTAPIAAQAFTFSALPAFTDIVSVSITFTVIDGDTGLGPNGIDDTPYPPPGDGTQYGDDDFDVNSWTLELNGINLGKGLLLNGYNAYDNSKPLAESDFVTVTTTGSPANAGALLTALDTGALSALIYDSTGASQSNGFEVPNTEIDRTTPLYATLSITGDVVPEPAGICWLAMGAGAMCIMARHRRLSEPAATRRAYSYGARELSMPVRPSAAITQRLQTE